jgi:hypothetical protein
MRSATSTAGSTCWTDAAAHADDASGAGAPPKLLIYLGDLVSRGPDSRGVVERCAELAARWLRARGAAGNHEDLLLRSHAGEIDAGAPLARLRRASTPWPAMALPGIRPLARDDARFGRAVPPLRRRLAGVPPGVLRSLRTAATPPATISSSMAACGPACRWRKQRARD